MIYVQRMNFDSVYENITGTTYPYTAVEPDLDHAMSRKFEFQLSIFELNLKKKHGLNLHNQFLFFLHNQFTQGLINSSLLIQHHNSS